MDGTAEEMQFVSIVSNRLRSPSLSRSKRCRRQKRDALCGSLVTFGKNNKCPQPCCRCLAVSLAGDVPQSVNGTRSIGFCPIWDEICPIHVSKTPENATAAQFDVVL